MKNLTRLFLAAALLPLAACNPKTATEAPKADPQEIERRVQERLAEEHRLEQERKLQDKEQTLAEREKNLTERERETERARTATEAAERDARRTAELRKEEQQRETPRVAERAPEPVAEHSYELFYRELDADGDWIETDRYGYVWRPNIAVREAGWRPYSEGHWADTDDGWTWVSSERFGWAVYHYGRWTRLARIGWAWVPGDEWAPAWVSWRHGDEHVGWAPLPPEAHFQHARGFGSSVESEFGIVAASYLFVSIADFCAPRVRDVIIAPAQNVTIINRTTNITNIRYNNTTIINQGPRVDVIAARSRQRVQRLTIVKNAASKPAPAVVNGNQLVVAAPTLPKNTAVRATPARVAQRVTEVQTEVQTEHAQPAATSGPTPLPAATANPTVPNAALAAKQQAEAERRAQAVSARQKAEADHAAQVLEAKQKAEADHKAQAMAAQQRAEADQKAREAAELKFKAELEQQKMRAEEAKAQRAQHEQLAQKARLEQEAARREAAIEHQRATEAKIAKPVEKPVANPQEEMRRVPPNPHATPAPAPAPPQPGKGKVKGQPDDEKKPPQ